MHGVQPPTLNKNSGDTPVLPQPNELKAFLTCQNLVPFQTEEILLEPYFPVKIIKMAQPEYRFLGDNPETSY